MPKNPALVKSKFHKAAHAGTVAMLQYLGTELLGKDFEAAYLTVYTILNATLLLQEAGVARAVEPSVN